MPRMRILFSAAGGYGHLRPLVPLARAAASAGHEVLVSATPSLAGQVQKLGLLFAPSGPALRPIRSQLTLRTLDEERQAIPRHFIGNLGPARARDLIGLARAWEADLIVGDEADYGAVVAAESIGVPHVTVVVIGAGGLATPELVRGPLGDLRAAFDLAAEDGCLMLERSVKLNPFPPEFRDPRLPLAGRVINYRPTAIPLCAAQPDPGQIYVTLGTIFNTESGDLLARLSSAVCAATQVDRVIVATGEHLDPADLGPQPPNVAAHGFVDQQDVLSGCSAVVCHGGSGTVLDALSYGLPMVLLPLGADQSLNADRCRELGCGVVLRADQVSTEQVAKAVDEVLTDQRLSDAARRLQGQLARLPGAAEVVQDLEELRSN